MSNFAKRHYEFLAITIYNAKPPYPPAVPDPIVYLRVRNEITRYRQWEKMVRQFASALAWENSRFNPTWFIHACKTGDMRRQR